MSFCFFLWIIMIRAERQAKILQIIREREYVENSELGRIFDVTLATVRRDLKDLSEQRLVRIDHGGAYLNDPDAGLVEPLYETKLFVNHEAKRAVGQAAAGLVQDGDAIILDSGTTNRMIARNLCGLNLRNLTVITCDIMIASELCATADMNVIVLGGLLRKTYFSTYGPYTEAVLRNLHASKFFLGIDGADMERGIGNIVLEEVPVKQLQMEISDRVILVADSTKFGKTAPHRVCGWSQIDQVVTDPGIPPAYLNFYTAQNIPVLCAPPCCGAKV